MKSFCEKSIIFGKNKSLIGIITEPYSASSDNNLPAIILLNAGDVHRVGPNRLYVKMARKLAETGLVAFRFDLSGNGDSSTNKYNLSFEKSPVSEVKDAIDYLGSTRRIKNYILIGLCSGADLAYQTACAAQSVVGAILINGYFIQGGQDRNFASYLENQTQGRYYLSRMFSVKAWWRLLTGESNFFKIKNYIYHKLTCFFTKKNEQITLKTNSEESFHLLTKRGVDLLLFYSEGSSALDNYYLTLENSVKTLQSSTKFIVEIIQHTDHVFTLLWSQQLLIDTILQWVTGEERIWSLKDYNAQAI